MRTSFVFAGWVTFSKGPAENNTVDETEFANRWVYTLVVELWASPIASRNVRVNMDTNELQLVN